MAIFDPARGRVVDVGGMHGGGGGLLRLIGIGGTALLVVILLFSSVTRVGTGHVGVLTLFGKVTGETLGEGMHLINPLKTNNEMSIQTLDAEGIRQRAFKRGADDEPGYVADLPSQSRACFGCVPENWRGL